MRFLCTLVLLTFAALPAMAQSATDTFIKATTAKGERVLLKADGAWETVVDAKDARVWRRYGEIRSVTLFSRQLHRDYEKATFSFRVEEVKSRDTCTISWIVVPSPERRASSRVAGTGKSLLDLLDCCNPWRQLRVP